MVHTDIQTQEGFYWATPCLQAVLTQEGITQPTTIQSQTWESILQKKDILAQAPTGSGKTLAVAIPLGMVLESAKQTGPRILILAPTRELASQISNVLKTFLRPLGLQVLAITGGESYHHQKKSLQRGVDIVIGTPGRVCDLMRQDSLNLATIEHFVLDEVDQMLDIGFADELQQVRQSLPEGIQTLFFSATLGPKIRRLAKEMLHNPAEFVADKKDSSPSTISHSYIEVRDDSRLKALINTLLHQDPSQAIIFCETRQECSDLAMALQARGFSSQALHGDLSQDARSQTMTEFKKGTLKYLIATNVAARGIDVQNLPLVINYSVPWDIETYTHRVGRTGRAGATGAAWTLVTPKTARNYRNIIASLRVSPLKMEIPQPSEIMKQTLTLKTQTEVNIQSQTSSTAKKVVQKFLNDMNDDEKNELLTRMLQEQMVRLEMFYVDDLLPRTPLVENFQKSERFSSTSSYSKEGRGPRRTSEKVHGEFQRNRSSRDSRGRGEYKPRTNAEVSTGYTPRKKAFKA